MNGIKKYKHDIKRKEGRKLNIFLNYNLKERQQKKKINKNEEAHEKNLA